MLTLEPNRKSFADNPNSAANGVPVPKFLEFIPGNRKTGTLARHGTECLPKPYLSTAATMASTVIPKCR